MADILADNEKLADFIVEAYDMLLDRVGEDKTARDNIASVMYVYMRGCELIDKHVILPPQEKEGLMIASLILLSKMDIDDDEIIAKYGETTMNYLEEMPQNDAMLGPYMSTAMTAMHVASFAALEKRVLDNEMTKDELLDMQAWPPRLDTAVVTQCLSRELYDSYRTAEKSLWVALYADRPNKQKPDGSKPSGHAGP